jgi:homoserine O-acetyltransferase/O-succinyltransferase
MQMRNHNQPMKKFIHSERVVLESGLVLPRVEVAAHTYGHLNPNGDNVIWVFHALTANSNVPDWWPGLFGEKRTLDPSRYFIVCANILGSCYGTTGPSTINPETNERYGLDFPNYTIRDMVTLHRLLAEHLGIHKIALGIGGSLGGQQLLEWACIEPHRFEHIVAIATNACHSPWGIAFNTSQRMALEADSDFHTNKPNAGQDGLRAARAMALLSYRHYDTYAMTQKDDYCKRNGFSADSYQRYQGEKLVQRFDAHSYYRLSQAMDSHHLGRHRKSVESALQLIRAKTAIIAIDSDLLFPVKEQLLLANMIPDAKFHIVQSDHGHDGFLIETNRINQIVIEFFNCHQINNTPNNHSVKKEIL